MAPEGYNLVNGWKGWFQQRLRKNRSWGRRRSVLARAEPIVLRIEPIVARFRPILAGFEPILAGSGLVLAGLEPILAGLELILAPVMTKIGAIELLRAQEQAEFASNHKIVVLQKPATARI